MKGENTRFHSLPRKKINGVVEGGEGGLCVINGEKKLSSKM